MTPAKTTEHNEIFFAISQAIIWPNYTQGKYSDESQTKYMYNSSNIRHCRKCCNWKII